MLVQDSYLIKIFATDGTTFERVLSPNEIKALPSFNYLIEGSTQDLTIDIVSPWDDLPDAIELQNVVNVSIINDRYPRGKLRFRGLISEINPYTNGSVEGVKMKILSLISLLSDNYFKNGSNYSVTKTTMDPGDIIEDIIDHFNTVNTNNLITYTGTSIDTIGVNVTYTYTKLNHLEAIKKTFEFVPAGWYWYIDENGVFYLKEYPTTPTHKVAIGKYVQTASPTKTLESLINKQRVEYSGGSSVEVISSASITTYGLREGKIISDTSITDLTTATQRATRVVNENKDPKITGQAEINKNYDIESIRPGDTISFQDFKRGFDFLPENMVIPKVRYAWDSATVELEQDRTTYERELKKLLEQFSQS